MMARLCRRTLPCFYPVPAGIGLPAIAFMEITARSNMNPNSEARSMEAQGKARERDERKQLHAPFCEGALLPSR